MMKKVHLVAGRNRAPLVGDPRPESREPGDRVDGVGHKMRTMGLVWKAGCPEGLVFLM